MTGGETALDRARIQILDAALPNVPFEGWSLTLFRDAAKEAGVAPDMARAAFPMGVVELLTFWLDRCDAETAAVLKTRDLAAMKVRERITLAVRTRLETMAKHRIAAQRGLSFFALPLNAGAGLGSLYRTVDTIWRAAGDTSTDFNFYTKRVLLAGVYTATLNAFLADDSEGFAQTWAYLDRRIADVMQIEKAKAQAGAFLEKLPDPVRALAALRYPR